MSPIRLSSPECRPTVTIGMPVYNASRHIREALNSIVSQTFQDFEVIISDNDSSDDTAQICEEYRKNFSQIKFVRQSENIGVYGNFDFVTRCASGELLTWLAHDDVLEPEFLERTVRYLRSYPNAVSVASDFAVIDENGRQLEVEVLSSIRSDIPWEYRIVEFFKYPISNAFFSIYGLTRTAVCQAARSSAGQPKMAAGSELPTLARIAVEGEIASIPGVLRQYRRHASSVYMTETARLAKKTRFIRTMLGFLNANRLRLDQMTVLWHSSLSANVKGKTTLRVLKSYCRGLLRRMR